MKTNSRMYALLTAALLILPITVQAAPNFDTGNLALHVKELVKREGRNKLMKYAGEYMEVANTVMSMIDQIKSLMLPFSSSTPQWQEWAPLVPESIAKLLKKDEPSVDEVAAEIKKLLLIDRTTPDTLKQTELQQRTMLMKVLVYAYGAAERSLDLSELAYKETSAVQEEINKTENGIDLVRRMSTLQTFSTRKVAEMLHLNSRLLEIDAMMGLVNKEKDYDEDKKDSSSGSTQTQ